MKIEIEVVPEWAAELTRLNLIESYRCAERSSPDNILQALMNVIEYYSTSTQYKEFIESIQELDL